MTLEQLEQRLNVDREVVVEALRLWSLRYKRIPLGEKATPALQGVPRRCATRGGYPHQWVNGVCVKCKAFRCPTWRGEQTGIQCAEAKDTCRWHRNVP